MSYTLGVLGGSGLYEMEGLRDVTELDVDTPFGKPSDVILKGTLENGTTLLFLPRHGKGHRVPPHQINYRANVCALKKSGCGGAPPVLLASGNVNAGPMALDDSAIYWVEYGTDGLSNGRLRKVAKP